MVRTRFGTPAAQLWYRLAPGLATPEQGADQLVWLATAPASELVNGAYYVRRTRQPRADDEKVASQLWDATESLLGLS